MKTLTAYIHGTVLDGTEQMRRIENAVVVVENGTIVSVSAGGAVPKNAKVVDLQGKYLVPGLINLHCHLAGDGKPQKIDDSTADLIQSQLKNPIGRFIMKRMCASSAKTELLSGTTTIRTVGGLSDFDAVLRDEIASGRRTGARIVTSNEAISVPGGHMAGTLARISHSPKEAAALVEEIAKGKPDLIKLMITAGTLDIDKAGDEKKILMPEEQVCAACDQAHRLGYPVAAHVQGTEGIKLALQCGVNTIEHGADLNDELVALFLKKKAALISTITVVAAFASLPLELSGLPKLYRDSCRIYMEQIIRGFKKAVAANIPIGMGLDNGSALITQYCMWRELYFFCRYIGTPPEFALYTATQKNADILGLGSQLGSIEVGKKADMLITKGNPLLDFSTMAEPILVVKEGIDYRPKFKRLRKYDALLDRITEFDADFLTK